MSFFEVLGPDPPAPSLNTTLAGIATVVQAAIPLYAVYAQPITIDATTAFPLVQILPWHYRVQELASGERGTLLSGTGALGPSQYMVVLLWSPIDPTLDQPTAARAMNDVVDAIINAWAPDDAYLLPDDNGVPTVQDSAVAQDANFGQQGSFLTYRSQSYLGCYITVDVEELTRP